MKLKAAGVASTKRRLRADGRDASAQCTSPVPLSAHLSPYNRPCRSRGHHDSRSGHLALRDHTTLRKCMEYGPPLPLCIARRYQDSMRMAQVVKLRATTRHPANNRASAGRKLAGCT
ncbi:hypothetical protein KGM_215390 [Danaus plexippus plexippus]|uniref:Uncharacterized protein n=1 Tax=Danaus plexippus plexippus TaxID=278856 RepID=A0A212EU11_DANPL|nr:hypothetical protein KGM_215390 [Danaus plexippus plexippus]